MTELLRLWNWAGGGLPGGALWLLPALGLWPALLYLVIRPIGVFRDRRPTAWLGGGWLILLGLHVLLRARSTPPETPPSLLLWPPDLPAGGVAVFARAEQGLRAAQLAGGLQWRDRPLELRITQHLLAPGRARPERPEEAHLLLEALRVRFLVQLGGPVDEPRLQLWHLHWSVCSLDDQQAAADTSHVALAAALHELLARNFPGAPAPATDWRAEWTPLYAPVADSARLWLELPTGVLPAWEDLRRTDLLGALGAPASQVVDGLVRALARADSSAAQGAEPWLAAGFWFARQADWEQVGQALTNALALEAGHPLIYWQLAHLAPSRLNPFGYDNRAQARLRCLSFCPVFVPALLEQVPDWLASQRGSVAGAAVDRALTAYPGHGELLLLRGNIAYEVLDYPTARRCYRDACTRLPGDARPWLNLGQLHVIHREWTAAIPALEQAVALGSPPASLHLLGLAHQKLGHLELARRTLERRLALGGLANELEPTRRLLDALPGGVAR